MAALALVSATLAVVIRWPAGARPERDIPGDLHDPLLQAWEVAWGGHALAKAPLHLFQANIFWPLRNTLAFSDSLVGYAPLALAGNGSEAALLRYNALYLFATALAFAGAFLLARELGAGRLPASAAGAAFAYAPWRLEHTVHLNILSSGGIPLGLYLLLRGYRRRSPTAVLAGWLVAAWQLSLGFNLGLQVAYGLAVIATVVAVRALRERRLELARGVAVATAAGVLAFASTGALLARPYLDVARDHPEGRRTPTEVSLFSPPPQSFLAAPEASFVWGRATEAFRGTLESPEEEALFPGVTVLLLAAAGLRSSAYSRQARTWLAVTVGVSAVLSLGFHVSLGNLSYAFPYRVLYEVAPGFDGLRTPGRLNTITSLGLALLAAAGLERLSRASDRRGGRWRTLGAPVVATALVAAVLAEGSGFGRFSRVPAAPHENVAGLGPQLHLPAGRRFDPWYMVWSTSGFPKLVNGVSGFWPRFYIPMVQELASFPDAASVKTLRAHRIETVVLHTDLVRRTAWEDAAARPIAGLHVSRTRKGRLLVYRIHG